MFTAYTEGADGRQQGGTSDFQGDFKNEVEEGEDYDDEEDEFVRDGSGKILRKWQQKKQRQNEMFRDRDRRAHEARREEVVKEALYYSAITLEDSEEEEHHGMKGLPEHLCVDEEETYLLKNKMKPRPDTRSSAYKSFPDVKKELKTEIDDDIDDFPPKKRKEKRKRKRSRSRSRSRSRRKRSSRSPSRRRKPSGSPQPGSSKNRPQQLQQPSKNSWNLLKTSTYREIDQNLSKLIAGLLVYERSREREAEIFDSVGRQAAKFRIAMRFIDNGSQKLFNIFYPSLGAKLERETRSFHQKLAVANKHQPRETQFRRCEFDWNGEFIIPLSDKPYDKYDLWLEEGERRKEAEAKIEQCGALGVDVKSLTDLQVRNQLLNSQLNKQPKNIELWLDFIKLQDEIYLSQKESGAMDNAKRMLRERKDAILVDAIAKNPRVSLFQRMYIENMIADPMTVYKKYEDLLHKFPHEIHIWEKYLDYVQHNNSLYGREQMDKAFNLCFEKLIRLLNGTMLSHIPLVKDFDKLRTFYLRAYVRYIRWLISVGSSPRAIANIQATFEVNFGAGAKCRQTNLKEREADLRFYWNTSMPRIGDSPEILGMAEELKNYGQMSSAEILELEKTDSELQKHQMMVAVTDDLCDLNEPIGRCWVRFERRMETADARVKRHPLEVSDAQELELMELEDTVKEDEITPYYSFRDQDVDFIMPLLQALGVKFVGGNEVYSSSDDILQAWFDGCNQNCSEFRTLPSAKPLLPCRKIGVNILRYLYDKIFTFESGHPLHRVFYSSEALTEFSIVEADSTLSTSLEKLKYFFSKGGPLIKPNMSMEASHIILLVLADKVSKLAFQAKREAQNQGPKAKAITDKAVEKLIMLLRNVIRSKSTEQERLLGVSPYTKSQELNSIQRDFLALITVLKFFDDPQVKSRNIAALLLGMDTEKADKLSNVDLRRAVTTIEGIQENIYKIEQKENEPNSHKSSLHVLPTASVLLDVLIMHLRVNIAVQDAKDSTEANYAIDRLMDVSKVVRGSDNETYRNINLRFIHTELILAIGSKFIFRDRFCSVLHLAIEHLRFEPFIWITYIETFNRGSKRLTTSIFMSHRQIFVQEVAEKDPNIYSDVERLFMSLGLLYMQCRHYRSLDEHLGSDSILKRLLTSFTEQATLTRDPSIWRLALRVAVELGNQRLIQETHVLANGQCSWARDIHLDYAMAQTNENGFQQAMLAILESNSHLFIDDVKNIEAIREIHQAKQMLE